MSHRSIKCVFVGYSRAQKWPKESFVSADVTFLESVPYFSPQGLDTTSESILLPPAVPLSASAPVAAVSSLVSSTDITVLLAQKPFRNFRYVNTHQTKVPAFESILVDSSSGRSFSLAITPPSNLDVSIASVKVNDHVLIILFLILFPMIVLIPPFASLLCLCLLSLFLGLMRSQYWYQPRGKLWIKRWIH